MPTDEAARLAALHQYAILDTEAEPGFDDLTAIASSICGAPIGLVTFVDRERQWFKSRRGLSIAETSRDVALCAHAIEQQDILVVSDALADERFRENPLVVGEPYIRFYAGVPLRTPAGYALGTLCVIDHVARTLTASQIQALTALARQAEAQLELRKSLAEARTLAAHLQAERTRLEEVLTAAEAATWELDLKTGQGTWSGRASQLFGMEAPAPLTVALFYSRLHPEDRLRFQADVPVGVGAGGRFEGEYRVLAGGNAIRWIRAAGRIDRDSAGRATRISGITTDVTERRRAEASARDARARAEHRSESQKIITTLLARASSVDQAIPEFLRSAGDLLEWDLAALWMEDRAGGALRCRAAWQRPGALGGQFLALTEVASFERGLGIPGRVWEDGQPLWIADVTTDPNFPRRAAAVDSGIHAAFAVPVVRHVPASPGSASSRHAVVGVVEFYSREAREPDREILNMFGSLGSQFGEFLERIEALEALRDSEHKMRRVVDTSIDGVISIDAEGRIVDWNPQAELMFGWTRSEAAGQDLAQLIIPGDQRDAHRRGMARYHATGEGPVLRQRIETEAMHRDGRVFPIELSIAALRPWQAAAREDGSAPPDAARRAGAMFSGFVRDISERRRTETALRLARDQAETTARARADFLATMSHEIRTPLNGVIGMLQLALKTSLSPAQREQLDTARRSADLLLAVANDVLDLSRIEAGRLTIEQTPFALRPLIEDVLRMLRPQVGEGVTLSAEYEGPEQVGFVMGDPLRLSQILMNVVGNAVKFTRRGRVLLRVQVSPASTDGRARHRFLVEDTGIGIAADKQSVIFDAFTQGDRSTTRRFGGTGLGLPIAARLAQLMDGTLELLRSSGEGSVFELVLPLRPAARPGAPDARVRQPRRLSGRVLVVDDNHVNRVIAEAMLRDAGCTVELAEHGREAIRRISQTRFDLVLMDCQMPEIDGYETTKLVRGMGQPREVLPIVAMTASALPEDRVRCLAAGMNDYVTKPLVEERLLDVLGGWLGADDNPKTQSPPAGVGEEAVLDHARVRRLREVMSGSPDSWRETIARFISDGEQTMADIAGAVDGGLGPRVRELAHALRGASGMMGAARLSAACAALEQAGADARADEYGQLAHRIRREFAAVVEELGALGPADAGPNDR